MPSYRHIRVKLARAYAQTGQQKLINLHVIILGRGAFFVSIESIRMYVI